MLLLGNVADNTSGEEGPIILTLDYLEVIGEPTVLVVLALESVLKGSEANIECLNQSRGNQMAIVGMNATKSVS